jgi:hypothetical protein
VAPAEGIHMDTLFNIESGIIPRGLDILRGWI